MKKISVLLSVLVLSACTLSTFEPKVVQLNQPFDEGYAQKLLKDGNNKIVGNAFLRQNGGGVVTCAGSVVSLVPVTAYAKERIEAIYGGDIGVRAARYAPKFEPDYPKFRQYVKTSTCDSRGDFEFDNVADGEFYVQTTIQWRVGHSVQGASLLKKVSLSGGKVEKIIMAPN